MNRFSNELKNIIYTYCVKNNSCLENIICIIDIFGDQFLNYIKSHKISCINASKYGYIELFKWLVENKCLIIWNECTKAAKEANHQIMEQWTNCNTAVYNHNFDALRWL